MILYCEGGLMLVGLISLLAGTYHFFGRNIQGLRRAIIGAILMLQAPVSITVGSFLLGDTPSGSIENVPIDETGNRLTAFLGEWGIWLLLLSIVLFLLLSAPRVGEEQATSNS